MRSSEASSFGRVLACQSDRRLQPRERRAQLVGHVVQQAPLRRHEALELLRHAVEVVAEIGDLVAAACMSGRARVSRRPSAAAPKAQRSARIGLARYHASSPLTAKLAMPTMMASSRAEAGAAAAAGGAARLRAA